MIANKNKAEKMLSTLGLQLSEGHRIISLAKDSISPLSENVNSKIKKSVEDIEVQPIEESSDGTAMQNYSRALKLCALLPKARIHDVVIEKETSSPSQDDLLTTGSHAESDSLFLASILRKIISVKNK